MSKKSLKDSLQLNKPRRTPNHPTKSHVVKINDNGTERLIRFGQQGVSTAGKPKKGESKKQKARRKSFKARHAKNIAKGKTSAAYWANKVKWNEGGRVLGVTGDDPLSEAMGDRLVTQQRGALADLNDDGYIDIIDAYEFLRPSYPTEIAGALKQAGSDISQGDIAKGMAMAGLGTLMAADYIPGAKFATSTIGRPIKSFLQEVGQKLPDTSVLEAASYKGRLGERLGSSPQQKMTVGQVRKLTEDISPTEKQFIEPELEDVRYQAKLQEMAGEKPDDTVTTEYLQKALQRRVPKSGAIREELRKFDDTSVGPEYATTMRRPQFVSPGYDPIVSDEYQELIVGLTPEMAVQYQKENMRTQGGNYFTLRNPHFNGHENTIFHIRSDRFQDNAIPGQKGMEKPKNVTFAEEMQSDTAIAKTQYGEFDLNTEIDLNTPRLLDDKQQLAIVINNEARNNSDLMWTYGRMSGEQFLTTEAVEAGVRQNILRAFRELDNEKITLGNKAKLQEELQEEIDEIAEDINLAKQFIPEYKMKGDFTALRDAEEKVAELIYERERVKIKQRLLNRINMPAGVPKGFPFLKEWPKLAMQRLINEGVDNADDAIGWISGAQSSNARQNTRMIESFEYDPEKGAFSYFDEGRQKKYNVGLPRGRSKETGQLPDDEDFIRSQFGDEVADVIFKDNTRGGLDKVSYSFDKSVIHDLKDKKGKNLAEGPKQLYDTVMVKEAKKIGKKYGVEPYQTPNGDWRMDITDKMREDFLTDVTYAEGGSVELNLGMDERDFQREITKQRSSIADLNNDGVVNYIDLIEAIRPTAPQELQEMGQTIIKLLSDDEIAKATAMAGMMGVSMIPFGRTATAGPRREMTRSVMKEYDPNIVESRAEEIVKGAESRGGKGPRDVGDTGKDDYSRLTKEELDPVGYQATKMDKPIEKVDIEEEQVVEMAPRKQIGIEDIEGDVVLPFYGDRASTGKRITRVDDIEFETPVDTEGGKDFMRGEAAQSKDKAIWASEQAIIRRLNDRAKQVADETGKDVLAITGTMSPNAIDFNTMGPEALAEMVAVTITRGGIKKKDIKEFNAMMKRQITKDPDLAPVKDWPGLDAPNLREYLVEAPSRVRKKFMRLMEKKDPQAMGLPSPGKARLAVTDKEQLMLGPGMFGGSIGKIDVDADIITDPLVPHKTYNTQLRGEYIGEIDPVPQRELFRDLYEARKDVKVAGRPENEAHKTYTMKTQLPAQEITPEIVDRVMTAAERKKRGYQEGGSVEGSILDKVFDTLLGAQATGGIDVSGGRSYRDILFFDGEKVSQKTLPLDQIQGFAELGIVKNINDNLVIDASASVQGGMENLQDLFSYGQLQAGPAQGGITYQTDDGSIRLGGRYDPQTDEKFIGVQGKLRFAKGGVYNAKKVDMMADQILEAYDV